MQFRKNQEEASKGKMGEGSGSHHHGQAVVIATGWP